MKTKSILPCPCMALLAVAATAAGAINCAPPAEAQPNWESRLPGGAKTLGLREKAGM